MGTSYLPEFWQGTLITLSYGEYPRTVAGAGCRMPGGDFRQS